MSTLPHVTTVDNTLDTTVSRAVDTTVSRTVDTTVSRTVDTTVDRTVDHTLDSAALRKARGAFFTPPAIARYVTEWAVRTPDDRVLEPSCGEAAFLLAAGQRLNELGADPGAHRLFGSEVHTASATVAREALRVHGLHAQVSVEDFFRRPARAAFDAVVGNPPYVRYQAFTGDARTLAKAAALRAGVRLTNLASSWAAFTVHAAQFVRPGGRLGLVLPAELLTVNYAAPVREHLMRSFRRVRLVLFEERVFPGVLEEVVLLLAEGKDGGPTAHCELTQAGNAEGLASIAEEDVARWEPGATNRWSALYLDDRAARRYDELLFGGLFAPLRSWGETTLGIVTGRNGYFALTGADIARLRLAPREVQRISPPGSRHLRALTLERKHLDRLDAAGRPTWLFRPDETPSAAARRYIERGRAEGVDTAYKCRVRRPWWRVPYVPPADLLLTYMNADTARLCANPAAAHHLNSVHGVYVRPDLRADGTRYLPLAALNSMTLLGAEVVGRAYGGGILKLEPTEADRWPMPSPELVRDRAGPLETVRSPVLQRLRERRLLDAVALVDEALFGGGNGPFARSLEDLRASRRRLHDRRVARGRA